MDCRLSLRFISTFLGLVHCPKTVASVVPVLHSSRKHSMAVVTQHLYSVQLNSITPLVGLGL